MPVSFGKYGEVREIGEVTPENWPGGDYNKVGMKVKKHRIKFIDGDMVCTDPKEGSEITIEEIKDLKTFLQGIRWMLDGDEDLMLSVLRNGVDSEVEGLAVLDSLFPSIFSCIAFHWYCALEVVCHFRTSWWWWWSYVQGSR